MSDQIKHECGIVLMRLLKPLDFDLEKYGTPLYGLHKLQLLMQKMRTRGQDGAGVATIKLDLPAGSRYISRKRSNATNSLQDVFDGIYDHFEGIEGDKMDDMPWLKENIPYIAEVMLGHLRYGTHGTHNIENVHPFLRQSNWMTRNLVLAGNFYLTNTDELFDLLAFRPHQRCTALLGQEAPSSHGTCHADATIHLRLWRSKPTRWVI